jgi:hypothetical protein
MRRNDGPKEFANLCSSVSSLLARKAISTFGYSCLLECGEDTDVRMLQGSMENAM